jgi:hypothetical protein
MKFNFDQTYNANRLGTKGLVRLGNLPDINGKYLVFTFTFMIICHHAHVLGMPLLAHHKSSTY